MAKRRAKTRTRTIYKKARRVARRTGIGNSKALFQLDAMAYGAVRAPISNWVQSTIPIPVIGNVGDEVAMGLLNWMVAKNTSGMMKKVALKGLVVENARFGESISSGFGLGQTQSSGMFTYG